MSQLNKQDHTSSKAKNKKTTNKNTTGGNQPETTGHQWDGIQEYDTPSPRWWLIVFICCIIWAIIYAIFYPSLPSPDGNTKGLKGWTKFSALKKQEAENALRQKVYNDQIDVLNLEQIKNDPKIFDFAVAAGKSAFKANCVPCHGSGAQGSKGFPNLNDDDWLWGGKLEDIYATIRYGIRSSSSRTHNSAMPAFGLDQILKPEEIKDVAEYVMSLSQKDSKMAINERGRAIFAEQCSVCHGADGRGGREVGAPNLSDSIWLYGKNKEDIIYTITHSRSGVMPAWEGRLDDRTIKELTIYVHSLGGGEN